MVSPLVQGTLLASSKPHSIRKDHWQRIIQALFCLCSGYSTNLELERLLDIRGGTTMRLLNRLEKEKFVERRTIPLGQMKIGLITLTDFGKRFIHHQFGWEVLHSDWEILVNRHQAETQTRHAAAILYFAYHARLRDWKVEICPVVNSDLFLPDVLVKKNGQPIYVEIELNPYRDLKKSKRNSSLWPRKWKNQYDYQKQVAICTLTPARRKYFSCILSQFWSGLATDLFTLRKSANEEQKGELWIDEFNS
jgi:DNA-binding PadR family transcriptional regulator